MSKPDNKSKGEDSCFDSGRKPDLLGNDKDWRIAKLNARKNVSGVLRGTNSDENLVRQSCSQVCAAMEQYIISLMRVTKRTIKGQPVYRRSYLRNPLAAVEALKRLTRTKSLDARARAWTELPSVAMDALNDACLELRGISLRLVVAQWPIIPGTFVQFDPTELEQLVKLAILKAQGYGNRNAIRDNAVITILREQARLLDRQPSAVEASSFLRSIYKGYRDALKLPERGFEIGSDAMIYRFLIRAITDF